MTKWTHIDLFTGIGGFTLACQWNGIETEVFCENDKRCQEFLRRTYPGIPIVSDVREFDGTQWRGKFLLTAGVPCQPASRAGKQRGKDDDRWLWPEALRIVSEARPYWVLFENPFGINDVGLDGILSDLEGLDYEIAPPLIIPACAVNSPQLRNRYWIVGNCNNKRCQRPFDGQSEFLLHNEREAKSVEGASQGNLADNGSINSEQRRTIGFSEETETILWSVNKGLQFWDNSIWLTCADGKLRRAPDDSFSLVDGLHRSILGALGNSIVPQVVSEIIRAIKEIES